MTEKGATMALEKVLAGGGETGALMRAIDWSTSPLGPVEQWPQSLKTTMRIVLTSRQPMFVWWGEQLINLYNDAYKSIVGGKHPQALGQPASQVWREIWDQVGPRARSAMLENEGTYDEALLLIMERNGYPEETYYTFSYSPVPNERGGTGGILCANTDDTQRIIGERQLALLRELAAQTADARTFEDACTRSAIALAENSYDLPFAMIYLVDPKQNSVYLAGTSGIDRHHPAVPAAIALDAPSPWPFAEVLNTHKPCTVSDLETLFGSLPSGAWPRSPDRAVLVPIAPSGQTGKAGILVAALNPYRLFDDNYRGFLELVAAQIAASIANAQAYEEERQRAEALAEIDRAKTLFFSNISHEFRTPLTLMLGPLEDILAHPSGPMPRDRPFLETAHRNALRLLKLVNTLLDFSRIEAGRVQAVYEPTDLAALTADLAGMFRSGIERAGMRLQVECPPLPEPVYVDREMWEKIVLNLLSNAFKFTWEGEITIVLKWAGDRVELEVRDTGTGIPAAELPHLFKRFHRVEGAKGRTYEGSGIGLSLVQELVHLHGGTIQVSSVLDRGTRFAVSIPTGFEHLPADRISATRNQTSTAIRAATYVEEALRWLPEQENGSAGEEEKTRTSPHQPLAPSAARILLADDNADMRDYVKRLLVERGYEVETVADGRDALARIRSCPPALILSDVMMPELDGLGLLRSLRADPNTRDIPIILLSARAGEESRIKGLEAGADDYLVKPFSARELLARVEATLKLDRMRQEAAHREQELRSQVQVAKDNLEKILSTINDQFLALDRDWRYTYANDRVLEVTGKSREELLGKSIWEIYPDLLGSQFYLELHRAVAEKTPLNFEFFYPHFNRWFDNHIYPSASGLSIFVTDISDRKQIEDERDRLLQELAIERARFEAVLQQMPAGVMIADAASGQLVLTNEQAKHILWYTIEPGLKLSEYEPMNPFRAFHANGEVYKPEEYPLLRSLQTGETIKNEVIELRRADNFCIFISANSAPILNRKGEILAAVVVFQDITDRRRTEQALQESERRFRRLVESNMFGVAFVDFAGGIHYANDYFLNMIGYTREELQAGKIDWMQVAPPEVSALDARSIAELRQHGVASPVEKEYIHKDGSRIPILLGSALLQEPYDCQQEIIAFLLDLRERKQAEAAWQEGKQILDALMEYIPEGITIADAPDVTIRRVSRYGQQLIGRSPEVLEGIPAEKHVEKWGILRTDGIAPPSPEELPLTRAVKNGEVTTNEEWVIQRSNGDKINILCNAGPIQDSAGNITGGVIAWRDITERKQAEKEREELLTREQAVRAEAETANRIKDEFLAVLSHELRSPLNPILGWSRLLQTRKFDAAKTAEALATIERNAKLQAELIEDLLDVSRILRGKLSLNIAPVNLLSTIEEAIETVRLAAEAKSIQIHTRFAPKVGLVLGDACRLQQVVWNILSNAVKFTPTGGRVEIGLERIDDRAQITITDTGKGIPVDFQPYVFDYFRQADATTTRKFGGLGLGLAIVRHLVELHGGTVRADSAGEGQGATFTVTLPLMPSLQPSDRDRMPPPASLDLEGIEILVVDDDADTREFVAFLLQEYGARVRAASSANDALAALAQSLPDVLLSDIGMPDVDGYMLVKQVRNLPPEKGGDVPAIALTAYAGEINYQQAMAVGFQRHVSKPVEPTELVSAIVSLARGSRNG